MLLGFFAALRALSLAWQLAIAGTIVTAIAAGAAYEHHKIFQSGYARAISDIAHENKEAVDAAKKLKALRAQCAAGGGAWDQSRGVCE